MKRVLDRMLVIVGFVLLTGAPGLVVSAVPSGGAKGYLFEASHYAIVSKAKKEGSLRALLCVDPASIKAFKKIFAEKYPFIDTHFEEITGSDSAQRFVLELAAGRTGDWDIVYLSVDHYQEVRPYLEKVDILAMAQQKILNFPPEMVNPTDRNAVSVGVFADVAAYNKKLLKPHEVPKTWEDFLKPELKGNKFVVDIKPSGLAGLVPAKGMEWVMSFARKVAAQEPIWARGQTRVLTAMAAGEYSLTMTSYYSSVLRARRRRGEHLEPIFIEPVPIRMGEAHAIRKGAQRPYAALLLLELMAGVEGQRVIDATDAGKASVFSPGSKLEQAIKGRKLSVFGWDYFAKRGALSSAIFKEFGFPKVIRKKR